MMSILTIIFNTFYKHYVVFTIQVKLKNDIFTVLIDKLKNVEPVFKIQFITFIVLIIFILLLMKNMYTKNN